jgi:hypothetical protein
MVALVGNYLVDGIFGTLIHKRVGVEDPDSGKTITRKSHFDVPIAVKA